MTNEADDEKATVSAHFQDMWTEIIQRLTVREKTTSYLHDLNRPTSHVRLEE